MKHSIMAIELCLPLESSAHRTLRNLVAEHPERSGYHEKWQLYRSAAQTMVDNIEHVDRGCWDYFDDNSRAVRDYDMWVRGMTTEEGARTEPSGAVDPYRGGSRFMTLTMAFLMVFGSPSDIEMGALCSIAEPDLWKRSTFQRILNGLGALSFASVKSDVIYVIPRDAEWGLTEADLAGTKFEYLRRLV